MSNHNFKQQRILKDKFFNFDKSLSKLEEVFKVETLQESFIIDVAIKRFEFTFEMCWKFLKKYLFFQGIEAYTPREIIKKAYQAKLIENEKLWLDILEDRNRTSHTYNEANAAAVFENIEHKYLDEFKNLRNKFESII